MNRYRKSIPDLSRQCLVFEFRAWIIWKLEHADTSGSIFQHLSFDVTPVEKLCAICQEMHKEAFFCEKKLGVT